MNEITVEDLTHLDERDGWRNGEVESSVECQDFGSMSHSSVAIKLGICVDGQSE